MTMSKYEDGMQIIWDIITREITVIFRGTVTPLLAKFETQEAGVDAGEELCRNSGWDCAPRLN
jgi:hypothetical protein